MMMPTCHELGQFTPFRVNRLALRDGVYEKAIPALTGRCAVVQNGASSQRPFAEASGMPVQRDIRSATTFRDLRSVLQESPAAAPMCPNSSSAAKDLSEGTRHFGTTSRISVSLSSHEYASLRIVASSGQRSLGWVMRLALRKFLESQTRQLELPFYSNESRTRFDAPTALERLIGLDWQRLRRRTSGTIQNLHSYPTRFSPEIPAILIETLSSPGDTVLDPFCGGGTTLVEAVRLGRQALGVDLSPLAILISRVKTTRLSAHDERAASAAVAYASSLISSFRRQTTNYAEATGSSLDDLIRIFCSESGVDAAIFLPNAATLRELQGRFTTDVLGEVLLIRIAIQQCPLAPARDFLMVALSSVLLALSRRKSDTAHSEVDRHVGPREPLDLWRRKVVDLQHLLAREQESLRLPSAELYEADARDLDFLQPCSVDLVVTSPPYPNTYDYRASERFRLLTLGLRRAFETSIDIGSPQKYSNRSKAEFSSAFRGEIGAVLESLKRVLKPSCVEAAATDAGFQVLASLSIGRSSTTASLHKSKAVTVEGDSVVVLRGPNAKGRLAKS